MSTVETRSLHADIRLTTPSVDEWDALWRADPSATFFHTFAWVETYARHHAGVPFFLTARIDGKLAGGLPAVRFPRGPFFYLESLPMGTYGGPIVDPAFPHAEELRAALLDRFLAFERSPRCLRVQCVLRRPTELAASRGFAEVPVHVVPVDRGYEQFWTETFSNNRRNETTRALRKGAQTRIGATREDLVAYAPLHREAHERWGLAPHPLGFFEDLALLTETVLVFVAHHEEKLLGVHFTFVSNDELIIWHGVTTRERSKELFPSTLLIRAEAEEAVRRGLLRLNLGGSGGRASIEAFKKLVGGQHDLTVAREREAWPLGVARRLRRGRA